MKYKSIKKSIKKKSIVGLIDLKNIILLIIGLFILVAFIVFFFRKLSYKSPELACQTNVALFYNNLRLNLPTIGSAGLSYPACKPIKREIKFKTNNELYDQLSKLIVTCWRMYGSGLDSNVFYDKLRDNKRCSLCYVITFKNKEKKEEDSDSQSQDYAKINFKNLLKYMSITNTYSNIDSLDKSLNEDSKNSENTKDKENKNNPEFQSYLNEITKNNGNILYYNGKKDMELISESNQEQQIKILFVYYVSKLKTKDKISSYILLSNSQNPPCDVIDN